MSGEPSVGVGHVQDELDMVYGKACDASPTPHALPAFARAPQPREKEQPARRAHRRRKSVRLGPPRPASLPRLRAASASLLQV